MINRTCTTRVFFYPPPPPPGGTHEPAWTVDSNTLVTPNWTPNVTAKWTPKTTANSDTKVDSKFSFLCNKVTVTSCHWLVSEVGVLDRLVLQACVGNLVTDLRWCHRSTLVSLVALVSQFDVQFGVHFCVHFGVQFGVTKK